MDPSAKLRFPRRLVQGKVTSRPNRFIMMVDMDGEILRCHCPVTGRIGDLVFDEIPCLVAMASGPGRTTAGTVEAISLDPVEKRKKSWIGIDQTRANDYVDFFLRSGSMSGMIGDVDEVVREVRLGSSRIDFLVNGRDYLEVKTPLFDLPCEGHPSCRARHHPLMHFDRMIRHFGDISGSVTKGSRGILLLCYLYDAKPFEVPAPTPRSGRIVRAAKKATAKGMEHWQLNLRVDEEGVGFIRCFEFELT